VAGGRQIAQVLSAHREGHEEDGSTVKKTFAGTSTCGRFGFHVSRRSLSSIAP